MQPLDAVTMALFDGHYAWASSYLEEWNGQKKKRFWSIDENALN